MSRSSSLRADGAPPEPRRDAGRTGSASAAAPDECWLRLTGWRPGFRKVAATTLLRGNCGYRLAGAKALVDRLLDGETVIVRVPATARADRIADELDALGVDVEHGDDAAVGN